MRAVSHRTRSLIAYLVAHYPKGQFTADNIPENLRGCITSLVSKGFITRVGSQNNRPVYIVTERGSVYINRYGQDYLKVAREMTA